MPIILALKKLKQENPECETKLGYTESLSQRKKKENTYVNKYFLFYTKRSAVSMGQYKIEGSSSEERVSMMIPERNPLILNTGFQVLTGSLGGGGG